MSLASLYCAKMGRKVGTVPKAWLGGMWYEGHLSPGRLEARSDGTFRTMRQIQSPALDSGPLGRAMKSRAHARVLVDDDRPNPQLCTIFLRVYFFSSGDGSCAWSAARHWPRSRCVLVQTPAGLAGPWALTTARMPMPLCCGPRRWWLVMALLAVLCLSITDWCLNAPAGPGTAPPTALGAGRRALRPKAPAAEWDCEAHRRLGPTPAAPKSDAAAHWYQRQARQTLPCLPQGTALTLAVHDYVEQTPGLWDLQRWAPAFSTISDYEPPPGPGLQRDPHRGRPAFRVDVDLELPNQLRFARTADGQRRVFQDRHPAADHVLTLCPITAEFANHLLRRKAYTAIFLPFNEELAPAPTPKLYDVVYMGHPFLPFLWEVLPLYNYRLICGEARGQFAGVCPPHLCLRDTAAGRTPGSGRHRPLYTTDMDVSHALKLRLIAQSRVAVVHTVLHGFNPPPPASPAANVSAFMGDHVPQFKARVTKALFARAVCLVYDVGGWPFLERLGFVPGVHFLRFTDAGSLRQGINAVLENPVTYAAMAERAYSKAVQVLSTRAFVRDFVEPLRGPVPTLGPLSARPTPPSPVAEASFADTTLLAVATAEYLPLLPLWAQSLQKVVAHTQLHGVRVLSAPALFARVRAALPPFVQVVATGLLSPDGQCHRPLQRHLNPHLVSPPLCSSSCAHLSVPPLQLQLLHLHPVHPYPGWLSFLSDPKQGGWMGDGAGWNGRVSVGGWGFGSLGPESRAGRSEVRPRHKCPQLGLLCRGLWYLASMEGTAPGRWGRAQARVELFHGLNSTGGPLKGLCGRKRASGFALWARGLKPEAVPCLQLGTSGKGTKQAARGSSTFGLLRGRKPLGAGPSGIAVGHGLCIVHYGPFLAYGGTSARRPIFR